MVLRILRFLAVLAVALFALNAYAHKIECEKDVGLVQVDGQGNVVLGEDGLPVFLSAPSPLLGLDSYPAAIGWRVRLNNLASETSIVASFEDPLFASSLAGVEVFGTVPAHGVAIPVGGSIEAVAVQRIGSRADCAGAPQGLLALEGPVCRDERENVAIVTTHADAASCRAEIQCMPAAAPPVVEGNLPDTCRTVNGIHWCYHPQLCGTGCEAVCRGLGMTLSIGDAAWLAAQDTQAECEQIAGAFGASGMLMPGLFNSCVEDSFGDHRDGRLEGAFICSDYPGCPAQHRVTANQAGVACDDPPLPKVGYWSTQAICPCSPIAVTSPLSEPPQPPLPDGCTVVDDVVSCFDPL